MKVKGTDIQLEILQVTQQGAVETMKRHVQREVQKAQEASRDRAQLEAEHLQRLLEEIKRKFDMLNKYLRIDIDSELEMPVAKIIEKDTNRVIRQIPPEYLLELMKRIDQMLGILLRKEV